MTTAPDDRRVIDVPALALVGLDDFARLANSTLAARA